MTDAFRPTSLAGVSSRRAHGCERMAVSFLLAKLAQAVELPDGLPGMHP